MFTLGELRRRGVEETMRSAFEIAVEGVDATYVTCDIDVLDGAYAAGTGAVDLVEVAPNWDPTGRTPAIASDFLVSVLGARVFSSRPTG